MTYDIERRADSWVDVREDVWKLASALAQTAFVPKAFRGNPAAVAAVILTGREMGLGPMASLRGIDSIDGKPSLSTHMTTARIYAAGHRVQWVEVSDARVTVRISRGDGLGEGEASWTMKDAQRAGLAGKSNWRNYPRHMLKARALSECASMVCPDVVLGLDAREDVAETEHAPSSTVVMVAGPEPTGERNGASETEPKPAESESQDQPALVSKRQLVAIHSRITAMEGQGFRKLDEDQRRLLIANLAGIEHLASAKDLTDAEAGRVLDQLEAMQLGQETPNAGD